MRARKGLTRLIGSHASEALTLQCQPELVAGKRARYGAGQRQVETKCGGRCVASWSRRALQDSCRRLDTHRRDSGDFSQSLRIAEIGQEADARVRGSDHTN